MSGNGVWLEPIGKYSHVTPCPQANPTPAPLAPAPATGPAVKVTKVSPGAHGCGCPSPSPDPGLLEVLQVPGHAAATAQFPEPPNVPGRPYQPSGAPSFSSACSEVSHGGGPTPGPRIGDPGRSTSPVTSQIRVTEKSVCLRMCAPPRQAPTLKIYSAQEINVFKIILFLFRACPNSLCVSKMS